MKTIRTAAGTALAVVAASATPALAQTAPTDLAGLTSSVSATPIIAAILAIGGVAFLVKISWVGIKKALSAMGWI